MGVEHAEGRRLAPQGGEDVVLQGMLHAVGEVPGMVGVAIVHGIPWPREAARS